MGRSSHCEWQRHPPPTEPRRGGYTAGERLATRLGHPSLLGSVDDVEASGAKRLLAKAADVRLDRDDVLGGERPGTLDKIGYVLVESFVSTLGSS
jgi:hypothetical protein